MMSNTTDGAELATTSKDGPLKLLGDFIARNFMFAVLLLLFLLFASLKPAFYSPGNVMTIVKQVSINAVIAFGMTLIIITGGIDLSAGSVIAFAGMAAVSFSTNEFSGLSIIMGLLVGAACGLVNGLLISHTTIPPFIATLGMQQAARGGALLWTNGRTITVQSDLLLSIGAGNVGPVPVLVIIALVVGVVTHIILKKTIIGKHIYAIGGNEQAAIVCGINVKTVKTFIYVYGGALVGLGAIMLTGRVSAGNPSSGLNYEFDAITATVIGGASLSGGKGTILGTVIGTLIIGVLNNGLTMAGVSPYWQQIIKGALIVSAVLLDSYKSKIGRTV